jgi:hypothetical protein
VNRPIPRPEELASCYNCDFDGNLPEHMFQADVCAAPLVMSYPRWLLEDMGIRRVCDFHSAFDTITTRETFGLDDCGCDDV